MFSLQTRSHFPDLNNCYRLINDEADGIPGLVIDRYQQFVVVQHKTAVMELFKNEIHEAILKALAPKGIVIRNDFPERLLERLDFYTEISHGTIPETVEIVEYGASFSVSLLAPSAGWSFERRSLRQAVAKMSKRKNVLDINSFVGAFGILCAMAGAKSVTCVLEGESSISLSRMAAEKNMVGGAISVVEANIRDWMLSARPSNFWDFVVVDLPVGSLDEYESIECRRTKSLASYSHLIRQISKLMPSGGNLVVINSEGSVKPKALLQMIFDCLECRRGVLLYEGFESVDCPTPLMSRSFTSFYAFVIQILDK